MFGYKALRLEIYLSSQLFQSWVNDTIELMSLRALLWLTKTAELGKPTEEVECELQFISTKW